MTTMINMFVQELHAFERIFNCFFPEVQRETLNKNPSIQMTDVCIQYVFLSTDTLYANMLVGKGTKD